MLLVLDNVEHMLISPPDRQGMVTFLLKAIEDAPDLKILVTSREPLGVRGEWLLHLEGLPCVEGNGVLAADDEALTAVPAVCLFVERARQAQWDFDLRRERDHVVRICRLVQGLPLGIELAASWVDRLSCRAIADRLELNLHALESPLEGLEPHHRSLWAALDSSWQLLDAHAQQTLARLAIFPADFDAHAASQVAGISPELLTRLVTIALVRQPEPGRYELHELMREFAWQKLCAMPHDEVRERVGPASPSTM
ncbi:MAG: hypothetical protein Q9O62_03505 [Ardenticatenia bacterium]|nr:hypothetical protein [Ardenticatenia bacterium]